MSAMVKWRQWKVKSISGDIWIDILLLYSVIIDFINGGMQIHYGVYAPIGNVYRLILMLVLVVNLKKRRYSLLPLGIFCFPLLFLSGTFLGTLHWAVSVPEFSLAFELTELAKVAYSFIVILYLYTKYESLDKGKVLQLMYIVFVFLGVFNLFCAMTGWGNVTYKILGIGTKAFYADGNSFGLLMNMLFPCAIVYVASTVTKRFFLLFGLLGGMVGSYLIATRAVIIGISLTAGIALFVLTACRFRDIRITRSFKVISLTILFMTGWLILRNVSAWIEQGGGVIINRLTSESLSSARGDLIFVGEKIITSYTSLGDFLWGNGKLGGGKRMARELGMGLEIKGIEADFYDSILYYGWMLGGLFIWVHFLLWKYVCSKIYTNWGFRSLMLAVAVTLWMGLSILAGHGFGNPLLAPVLGLLLVVSRP